MITENEKISIRELTKNDVEVIFELYSDKEAMKFRGSKPFENIEEAIVMLDKVAENIQNGTEFRYGIFDKTSGDLVGTCLITPVFKSICKVGCSFGKKYWRKGYGFDAMTTLTNYIFY